MTVTNQKRVARGNTNRYANSTDYSLYHAYARPSVAKQRAWAYCEELMNKYEGWGLKVLSYNTFMFTAAFLFEDKETGVIQMMYITPNYDVAVDY